MGAARDGPEGDAFPSCALPEARLSVRRPFPTANGAPEAPAGLARLRVNVGKLFQRSRVEARGVKVRVSPGPADACLILSMVLACAAPYHVCPPLP